MTNNIGKFRFMMSHSDSDTFKTDAPAPPIPAATEEQEQVPDTTVPDTTVPEIPPVPQCRHTEDCAMQKVRRYLGELWWLWAVAAAIFIINRKG